MDGRRVLKRSEEQALATVLDELVMYAMTSSAKTACAAAIVSEGRAVATGINGPADLFMPHCYCKSIEGSHEACRVHAEWQAIKALLMPPDPEGSIGPMSLQGSQLLVVRLGPDAGVRLEEPFYCVVCARVAMSVGVKEWVYQLPEGLFAYDAQAYDDLSRVLG